MKHSVFSTRVSFRQRGSTLVVVLVILIAMTFLGLGAMSDTNLQLSMVRNSQFQTGAYITALTEINGQLDAINDNAESDTDQIILDLVQTNTTVDATTGFERRSLAARTTQDPADRDFALLLDGILGDDADSYTLAMTVTEPNANSFLPVEGMSLSPDSTVKWLVMEFNSRATIDNTGTTSDQIQGFRYLSAN